MEHFCFMVILSLSGLAMALQLAIPCQAAQAQPQPIYDVDGHKLTGNNYYYMHPVNRNLSDQCAMASIFSRHECPLRAILTPCKRFPIQKPGVTVKIQLAAAAREGSDEEASPLLSTDLVIDFGDVLNFCMQRLQWHIDLDITKKKYVTVGHFIGMKDLPGITIKEPRFIFRAERHGAGYKLASCYEAPCRDLVVYDYQGVKWLTVEEDGREPLEVVFKKCPPPCLPAAVLQPH